MLDWEESSEIRRLMSEQVHFNFPQEHLIRFPKLRWNSNNCPIKLKFGEMFGLHAFT